MPLTVGDRLAHYDVTALIGEGGMGQVYQATDTKLHRDVALKVLPQAFTDDPDRLARFEREATVLASLNHTNIGHIYGLEEAEGQKALVLELVEGPTLADRIAQGPIPIDEALPIAKQIAEALEAAHEQGVIHRDLKPANIKVKDDGTVKVLDFGLAKAFQPDASDPNMSQSPTISLTAAATQMGMVIGTAAYMAPEQAKGKVVDKRADVWAFGAVLFEMLTGSKPFSGDDVSTTLARVIEREPDWEALPSDLSPVLSTYLRRCLAKEPKHRIRDIGDVQLAMEGAFETPIAAPAEATAAHFRVWQRPVPAIAAVLAALLVGGLAVWSLTRPAPELVVRFAMPLASDQVFSGTGRHVVAISPAHDYVAFTADRGLWLRPVDQMVATLMSEGERLIEPFFSPDGQWLGFWADGQLKRVSVSGGQPITLGPSAPPLGASWVDDWILFGQLDGIWRVPWTGGTPELVIPIGDGEAVHSPQMLPGGDLVLFTLRPRGISSWNASQIVAESLASGERTVLFEGGRDARYVPTGHLIFALEETLLAQSFDLNQLAMRGGAVALVEGVSHAQTTAASHFSVSGDGTLVYVSDTGGLGLGKRLAWVDQDGEEEVIAVRVANYFRPRVSPDGMRVAIEVIGVNGTAIWVADVARSTLDRVTSDAARSTAPVWTPDGKHLVFALARDGAISLARKSADGTGDVEHLLAIEALTSLRPSGWSPNGSSLVFQQRTLGNDRDVWMLSMEGELSSRPLLVSEADERDPVVSPNGQWIAYASDVTGRFEVYVQRFPGLGDRRLISANGGQAPTWAPDGRALFYLGTRGGGAPDEMVVVPIDPEPSLSVGTPEVLFAYAPFDVSGGGARHYDIAPDGRRFLVLSNAGAGDGDVTLGPHLNVVLNWTQELLERVPVN